MSNYLRLKKMLYVVSLAAVSIVLSLVEIPWLIVPAFSFLKIDFSEIAILVALLVLGTKETFFVILVRSIVRRLFTGFAPDELVGELLAAFASLAIILGYNIARKILKTNEKPLFYEVSVNNDKVGKKEFIITTLTISLSLTIILWAINFFFTTPFYFSYFAALGPEGEIVGRLHFTVFTWIPNPAFETYLGFLWFTLIGYIPFNLTKGILMSIIFLVIKPRIKYLEL